MAEKKEFTEEQMRAFCEEAVPILNQFWNKVTKHGVEEGIRVYMSEDYLSLEGSGLGGWELHNYGGKYEMKYEKRVALSGEEGKKDGE